MKQVILDTSFVLTAVRNKIDFMEELQFMGLEVLIPTQVKDEILNVLKSEKRLHFKEDAKLALKFISTYPHKEINIGEGHVDNRIKDYAREHKGVAVATLDRELKKEIQNPKIIIRNKRQLEIM